MNHSQLLTKLDALHAQASEQKALAMVYQREAKEKVAEFYGVPPRTFYFHSYDHWTGLCQQFLEDGGSWRW